jgi:hypothetical protein
MNAECALKNVLHMLSMREENVLHAEHALKKCSHMLNMHKKMYFCMLCQHRYNFRKQSKHFMHAECAIKNVLRMLSMR